MNSDVKTLWLAALRSGEYEQGRAALRDRDDKFCCLGVLCELAAKAGVIPPARYDEEWKLHEYGTDMLDMGEDEKSMHVLPVAVQDWADIKSTGGFLEYDSELGDWPDTNLAHFNDSEHYTFEQLADVIEKNF